MRIPFVKMCGAGNDMILVDHRARFLGERLEAFVRAACHRRYGVGADGLILIEEDPELDFRVRFFNPDGGEYGLCGNGSRCLPFFAAEIGLEGPVYRFRSDSGIHEGRALGPDRARIRLTPVHETRLDIPVELDGAPCTMDWGDIGVPHGVHWVDDVAAVPIESWGPQLRSHAAFAPDGTNVSFVQPLGDSRLAIRTFERGVEGETWACGSGSAVVATVARERGLVGSRVEFRVHSGEELVIHLAGPGEAPDLEGGARRCCEGTLDLEGLLAGPLPEIG